MNVRHKVSLTSVSILINRTAVSLALAVIMLNSSYATPCFDDPQSAYEYLLAQEDVKIQAREQAIININRASESELVSLDGVGSSKAQDIILYREMFGGFKTVNDLAKVKGIGKKTVEKNRGRLSVQD